MLKLVKSGVTMLTRAFLYCLLLSLVIHLTTFTTVATDWSEVDFSRVPWKMELSQKAKDIIKDEKKSVPEKTVELVQELADSLKKTSKAVVQELSKVKVVKPELGKSGGYAGKKGKNSWFKDLTGDEGTFEPPMEVTLMTNTQPDTRETVLEKSDFILPKDLKECPKGNIRFGGIGLQFEAQTKPETYKIQIIPKGYPASKSDLRIGDIIEGNPHRFRGEIGTKVQVDYIRNGVKKSVILTRVEICVTPYKKTQPSHLNPDGKTKGPRG